MEDKYINTIFQGLIVATIIFFSYGASLYVGDYVAKFIGLIKADIMQVIVTLLASTGFMFLVTILIQCIFQIIPFLKVEKFIKYYFGVHLLFIYISGLIAILNVLEPLLLTNEIILEPLNSEVMMAFTFMFFLILSNYNIYNMIVLENKFGFYRTIKIKEMESRTYIGLFNLLLTLGALLGFVFIGRLLIIGNNDEITLMLGMVLIGPFTIARIFFKHKEYKNNDLTEI